MALQSSSTAPAATKLGLASSHSQLVSAAADALVERVKRDGATAVEGMVTDKELLAALARPELLPRLASSRLFSPVCQQLVRAIRQQSSRQSSARREEDTPSVLPCPACEAQLAAATRAADSGVALAGGDDAALLPLSLAHLVSQRLYPQAAHLVYSLLQTHEYMRSLPAGLAEVHARLRGASKEALESVDREGGAERVALYEAALKRMKDDGVGQLR